MGLLDALILFIAMASLALVPSTSVALVVTRSSTAGLSNGAAVAAGIVVGDLLFVCLAILGMTAIAEALGGLFIFIKYLAGIYLIWFGMSLLRSKPPSLTDAHGGAPSSLSLSFFSGLIITLGDVKAIFFYASLFPSFIDLAAIRGADIAIIVSLTLVAVGGVKLGYAYAARRLASLAIGFKVKRGARNAAGSFMIGTGTYLMVKP